MSTVRAVLAIDLGTGGAKAALVDEHASVLASSFVEYPTLFPAPGLHEQRPADWWDAVRRGSQDVIAAVDGDVQVVTIALSGQSLTYLPVDDDLVPLRDAVPIWSDSRAHSQADEVFGILEPDDWYTRTGNGFPAQLYTAFKHLWHVQNAPDVTKRIRWLLGSKDWINAQLTGVVATDPSYASGLGAYSLADRCYDESLLTPFQLDIRLLPPIVAATSVVGGLLPDAAAHIGLPVGTPVVAGGVDNACMALGAGLDDNGRTYLSLGSSNWLTIAGETPVLDAINRPFVFDHVIPGLAISALSTFGGGSSLTWLADILNIALPDLLDEAAQAPVGSDGLVCIPTLAGGTVLEGGSEVRGSFAGLDLGHSRGTLARAVIEGIAFSLGRAADLLSLHVQLPDEILAVGGGARSPLLLQTLADVLGRRIVRVENDQQAAALGAATLGMIGTGVWTGPQAVRAALQIASIHEPDPERSEALRSARTAFETVAAAARSDAPVLAEARHTSNEYTQKATHHA